MDGLQFKLGESNGDDRQKITYVLDGASYPDKVDPDSAWERKESIKRALHRFGMKTANVEELDAQLGQLIADATNKGAIDKAVTYPAMTCAELMVTQFVVRFYIARILAAGQPLILAGPKKAMKTTLLVALMLSLATGVSFLGAFEVFSAVAVGMMTGESGLATIKETIRRIAETMLIDPALISNIVISDKVPQLGDMRHLDAIREFIIAHNLKVLIIDPAYMAMSGAEAGNLFVQGQLLRGISELCQELDCTLVLCHHTKRNTGRDTYDPPELEDIAWAGFQEWARQWLLVGRREAYEPGSGIHRLWLTAGGSIGHGGRWGIEISEGTYDSDGGRWWDVAVMPAGDVRKDANTREAEAKSKRAAERAAAQLETDRKELVKVATRLKTPQTKRDLRGQVSFAGERFNRAFASVVEEGILQPTEIVKGNNRPFEAWKLRETTGETKP